MTLEDAIRDLAAAIREATDRKDKRLERIKEIFEKAIERALPKP